MVFFFTSKCWVNVFSVDFLWEILPSKAIWSKYGLYFFGIHMWMFPKIGGFPPKSSINNRVFHYVHHPFWVFSPFFLETPMYSPPFWLNYHRFWDPVAIFKFILPCLKILLPTSPGLLAGYLLPAFLPDKLPAPARWLVEPGGPLASKAGVLAVAGWEVFRVAWEVFFKMIPLNSWPSFGVFFFLRKNRKPAYIFGCFLKWWYPQNTPQNDHF